MFLLIFLQGFCCIMSGKKKKKKASTITIQKYDCFECFLWNYLGQESVDGRVPSCPSVTSWQKIMPASLIVEYSFF